MDTPEEASGFVNPFELMMMRQSARRDVLEAMFQSVVRQLVMTNDGDPTSGFLATAPLSHQDVDKLELVDVETLAGLDKIVWSLGHLAWDI